MPVIKRLPASTYLRMPWKNGGGLTSEIARFPEGAEDLIWRLSAADITASGPFSSFPGIDRFIVVIEGPGMQLRQSHRVIDLAPMEPCPFEGEAETWGELTSGAVRDLNLMVRRGEAGGSMRVHRPGRFTLRLPISPGTTFLYAAGSFTVLHAGRSTIVEKGDTLRVDSDQEALTLELSGEAGTEVIESHVRIL